MFDSREYMLEHGHEALITCQDSASGLQGWIALHSTRLGPGLGGIRLWAYKSNNAALLDVLKLSEGMTYKAAVAGLALGGAKAVVDIGGMEKNSLVRRARFQALGNIIDRLAGSYIAAEDVGTTTTDILVVRERTSHVVGLPEEVGGSGDPSPVTALGVFEGQKALIESVLHTDRFKGVRVSIQGLGKVGMHLASRLVKAGAHVIGTDLNPELCQRAAEILGIKIVEPDAVYDLDSEIFAPCALGGIINDHTLSRLRCKIVAGSANNQLEDARHGELLHQIGIVYAVDYVINAGGLINVSRELRGHDERSALAEVAKIYDTIKHMLDVSRRHGISETLAAYQMAMERLQHGVVLP